MIKDMVREEDLSPKMQELARVKHALTIRELYQFEEGERLRQRHPGPKLDLARALFNAGPSGISGEDREYLQESARLHNKSFDGLRPPITFRDLQAAIAGSGGYFVQTETRDPIDVLRPFSVTQRMGMLVETGLVGDQAVPKVTATTSPAWLSSGTGQVPPSQTTLSQIPLTPKQLGDVVVFSRQLAKQTNAAKFVGRELLRTIGTAIDRAVISGTGASGSPLGILNSAGVQTQSGATLNSGVGVMKQKAAEANVTDENIVFLSTPVVRQLLETRERATGGGRFVWDKDQVADRAAYVSTDCPTATMICGDWSLIYLGIWGEGFVLEVNPYDQTGFRAGILQARMIVSCDVAVLQAPGFVVASSIT